MRTILACLCLMLVAFTNAEVYFEDQFADASWESRWVESVHKGSDAGKFKWSAGKFYGDAEQDKGIQTSQDAKFYGLSAKFTDFSNEGKDLVIQFTVKHEQKIDCGGGYAKIFPADLDQEDMHGDSPYNIMFGPDICGPGTKKVHVIFNYKGKNLLIKKDIRCKDDEFTHLYTLIVKSDNSYEVRIDNEKAQAGNLEEDWDFLPSKMIRDPEAKKPEDWDDNERIDDPEDTKPEDWEVAEFIADPDAEKPEDWDDEMDGEWEPPMINNPEYKGEWAPKKIENPNYSGKWVHPEIENSEYEADENLYSYPSFGAIGFDLWQVKSGTIFDNVLITDDLEEAEKQAKDLFEVTKVAEKKMKDEQDAEERKQREEEDKRRKEEGGDDEEGDEDDEDLDMDDLDLDMGDFEEEEEEEEEEELQRDEL
ncbi:calreticulin precursor [Strongylocentrotus purpuratus]|uniref:Calreticulin n=1 Tax=Strongylocentrotus purpuratus TaxID=7668 RepID=Q9U6S0_STRPU|nr:calreticulin precursor [Strongylocentrotus purpuratus]AAD55725.1 calreticulin precursor [Strongylocentrotus purpuratus]|eukprot:NP_999643.1 calreticulin precursor [Strongylocentrotus purpuratus]